MTHIHGSSFVNSFRLSGGNELLKIWIVADRAPGGSIFRRAMEMNRPAGSVTSWRIIFTASLEPRPGERVFG
jgi:hypothetical protein